jgi:hypothetical protein
VVGSDVIPRRALRPPTPHSRRHGRLGGPHYPYGIRPDRWALL